MIFDNVYIQPYEEIFGNYTKEFIIEQLNRLDDTSKDLIATKIVELDKSNYYKETYINLLKKRIDKAIEYVEDNKSYTTIEKFVRMNTFEKHDEDILTEEMINDLLDILGGNNENNNDTNNK